MIPPCPQYTLFAVCKVDTGDITILLWRSGIMEPEQRIEPKPEKPYFKEPGFVVPMIIFFGYFLALSYARGFSRVVPQ